MTDETIYLVRHGETRWNVARRIQGQLDSELTDRGIEQAHAFGRLLHRHLPSDGTFAIEASPSGRATATARIIAEEGGRDPVEIQTTALLAERHMGDWAGLTLDEVDRMSPTADVRRTIDDPAFVPPGGESFAALAARARSWLARDRTSPVTIAVSHGLIGQTIRGAFLGHAPTVTLNGRHPQDRVFRLHADRIEELLAWADDTTPCR